MSRRRRPGAKVYSLSCTDDEWERARRRAERRGMSISRYFVERGLDESIDGECEAPPRLVLNESEQRDLYETVMRIAERTVPPESGKPVLTGFRNSLVFLVELTMRDMARGGREDELRALLAELFGERSAEATIDRLHAKTGKDRPGS